VTTITWDEPKRLTNLAKHGFDFADLNEAFFLAAVIVPARDNRHVAIGRLRDNIFTVVFAYLGTEGLSVISMRRADRNERKLLE
jgi:uncharacterized DUF497 family protein